MNSRQIEIYMEVATTGSFTDAAEHLYVSQPTVSRQMALLEEELGFPLFQRGNNYILLTPEGEIMKRTFERMNINFQNGIGQVKAIYEGNAGKLRLGFTSDISIPDPYMNIIHAFKAQYPNVDMQYISSFEDDFEHELEDGTIDLILAHDMELGGSSMLNSMYLGEAKRGLYYSVLHPLANKKDLKIQDFTGEINYSTKAADTDGQRALMKELTDYYNMPEFKSLYLNNTNQLIFHLRLGEGISIMDSFVLQGVPEDILILPVDDALPPAKKSIFWSPKNTNPSLVLFLNVFKKHTKNMHK